MKEVDFARVTACGECCTGCKKKAAGDCEGCIESGGYCKEWTGSGGCPIYLCAAKHTVQFCGLCNELPCKFLVEKVTWNKNVVKDLTVLANEYENYHKNLTATKEEPR